MMEKLGEPQTHLALKEMIRTIDEDKDDQISFREVKTSPHVTEILWDRILYGGITLFELCTQRTKKNAWTTYHNIATQRSCLAKKIGRDKMLHFLLKLHTYNQVSTGQCKERLLSVYALYCS